MRLVFATNNAHKIDEVAQMLSSRFTILSLNDIGFYDDVEETGDTFEANASLKSHAVFKDKKLDCFADDSGLEVDALNGQPGVYSARYAGEHGNHEANMDKLLKELQGETNRKARFRTVISLLINGEEKFFEGAVEGTIRHKKSGEMGFGYDPVFEPEGYDITFSEMSVHEKNRISHRGKAIEKMVRWLKVNR